MNTSLLPAGGLFRNLCFLFCFFPLIAWGTDPAAVKPRQAVKVLTVGNSFADNSTTFLPALAKSAGKKLVLFRANLGGHSMEQHVSYLEAFEADPANPKGSPYKKRFITEVPPKPAPTPAAVTGTDGLPVPTPTPTPDLTPKISLREALESQEWDVVTIQQVSHKSYKPETYQPFANTLIAYIRKYAPKAEILIQETWAYGDDALAGFNAKNGTDLTQQVMYDGLKAAYQKLSAETGLRILPVGDAFQKAREEGITVNSPKDIHANRNGQFLGAAIFYEMFFRDSVEKATFVPAKMDPAMAGILRKIAHQTVAEAAVVAK